MPESVHVKSKQPNGSLSLYTLRVLWACVVDARTVAAAQPISFSRGILTLRTKSSAWSQELSLRRLELARALNELVSADLVQDMRFRVTPYSPPVATGECAPRSGGSAEGRTLGAGGGFPRHRSVEL